LFLLVATKYNSKKTNKLGKLGIVNQSKPQSRMNLQLN